jgi:hypothetical protein
MAVAKAVALNNHLLVFGASSQDKTHVVQTKRCSASSVTSAATDARPKSVKKATLAAQTLVAAMTPVTIVATERRR